MALSTKRPSTKDRLIKEMQDTAGPTKRMNIDVDAALYRRMKRQALVYRVRFFGHKAALCGLVRGDGCGHPVPPCFGGASVAVLFQEPVLVVAIEVRPDGGADLLDVLEDTSENDLLLQRADEALGDAVGFRLTDESEAGRHAEEPQLALEVLGHEGAAVVVTQQHLARGPVADEVAATISATSCGPKGRASPAAHATARSPCSTRRCGDAPRRPRAPSDRHHAPAARRRSRQARVAATPPTSTPAPRADGTSLRRARPASAGAPRPACAKGSTADRAPMLRPPRHPGLWTAWTSVARPRCPQPQQPHPSLDSLHPSSCSSRFPSRQCRVHRNRVQLNISIKTVRFRNSALRLSGVRLKKCPFLRHR